MLLRGSTLSWEKKFPPPSFLSRRKKHLVSNLQSTISPIRLIIFGSTSEAKQTNKTKRNRGRQESNYFSTPNFFSNVKSTTSSDRRSVEDFGERWCRCVHVCECECECSCVCERESVCVCERESVRVCVCVLGMICEVLSFMSVPLNSFVLSQFRIPIFFRSETSKREIFRKRVQLKFYCHCQNYFPNRTCSRSAFELRKTS